MAEENWLTYAEAADVLGIKLDSVKRRARGRKWPRIVGNDGRCRIQLPAEENRAASRAAARSDDSPIPPDFPSPESALLDRVSAAEIRAAVAEARADGLSERLTEVKAALDDAKIERDRLLTIIEQQSAESRPAVVPVSIWDRIFGRR